MKGFIFFAFVLSAFLSNAQLPNKVKALEGVWDYKNGGGYEEWEMKNDVLIGRAYRVSKMGDTALVEKMSLKRINKVMVYSTVTFNIVNDNVKERTHTFLSTNRKMEFSNISNDFPKVVSMKLGFFNKNKLSIKIINSFDQKTIPIKLFRRKD